MAHRPSLGSRLINLRPAEPEQPIDDDEGDPEAEAALDAAVQHLKSLKGRDVDPHALLAALDDVGAAGRRPG